MPNIKGVKTRKYPGARDTQPKTRHHSNLRPKHKHTKDFLKVYYPYLPLIAVSLMILAVISPWQARNFHKSDVLPYATQMSVQGLLRETNQRRQAAQVGPVKINAQLSNAAQTKANDMVQRNYWSHNTPEGTAPWQFINSANYSYKKAGENLAYGFENENQVISGWMNSPAHKQNLLDKAYEDVGFGFSQSRNYVDDGPVTVVVAMYGQQSSAVANQADSSNKVGSYNTLGVSQQPQTQYISKIQAITGGAAPWTPYAAGIIIGALSMYLLFKHGRRIRRTFVRGEKFVIHHPLLDVTIVSVIVLTLVICQQAGVIR